jgi:hypothetical protein
MLIGENIHSRNKVPKYNRKEQLSPPVKHQVSTNRYFMVTYEKHFHEGQQQTEAKLWFQDVWGKGPPQCKP